MFIELLGYIKKKSVGVLRSASKMPLSRAKSVRLLSAHEAAKKLTGTVSKLKSISLNATCSAEDEDDVSFDERMLKRWELLSRSLCATGLDILITRSPKLTAIYEELERETGFHLDESSRKEYYVEFSKMATPMHLLPSSQVKFLILKLGINIEDEILKFFINKRIEAEELSMSDLGGLSDADFSGSSLEFTYRAFLHIFADVHDYVENNKNSVESNEPDQYKFVDNFPLDPESREKQSWDLFCMILLLYCSFSVPYSLAFADNSTGKELSTTDYVDIAIDVIFMMDISLTFLTSYDDHGYIVKDFHRIAINYLKSWFLLDVAGSFPFDLVVYAALYARNGTSTQNLSGMKLIRSLKLIRAIKFLSKINKLKEREGYELFSSAIGIFSAIFILIFTSHLLGCVFTLLIVGEPDANWLLHYNPALVDASDWVRYITALYWATVSVTTMGYGDIVPVTHEERLMAIVVALTGAVVFSHCMGIVSSLITQITGVDNRCQEKFRFVAEYLQFRGISSDLKRRVKRHYTTSWKLSPAPYDEPDLLEELSPALRAALLVEIGARRRKSLPLFQAFDDECVGFLLTRLRTVSFEQGDVIYSRGERALHMYLILDGEVELSSRGKAAEAGPRAVRRGECFGELALFPGELAEVRPCVCVCV